MTSLSFNNIPPADHPIPDAVRDAAGGRTIVPVWFNEGGSTFRLGDAPDARYAKWAPAGSYLDLAGEAARIRWAGAFVTVPQVVEQAASAEGSLLVTAALEGEMAVTERWKQDPATAVRVIGESLRAFHDALPVDSCPFSFSAELRVAEAVRYAEELKDRTMHPDFAGLTREQALKRVADIPPVDKLVVCHGDTCAPNTLLSADGRFAGHVDLGDLGVADRWSDLAIATWSTTWNYGDGWQEALLEAYGIAPDPERTEYYRLLWEVSY
ncbi:aminoglycoside phosphotransferase [Catenulispora acidiphila DSM 44928]|uniref:Aminoglycoside phosphotransferase n=1 Tax=Catenulispora acidiphila (strain DSM 44928 / JCM 14897 / NBRC 102108 / NRRL B-24433 / ID139908) TaxID=479433 RepID=C7QIF6_CATAD|nr:aminoglycoside 3'-phosphotransferase [Catenulispora acidiphila]ACU75033.1 aminoglycoside phosphotransferase [Catenulispora acidiphila DSM 44928]